MKFQKQIFYIIIALYNLSSHSIHHIHTIDQILEQKCNMHQIQTLREQQHQKKQSMYNPSPALSCTIAEPLTQ